MGTSIWNCWGWHWEPYERGTWEILLENLVEVPNKVRIQSFGAEVVDRFPIDWRYGSRIADRVPDTVPNKRFWKNSRSIPNVVHNKLPGQLGCEVGFVKGFRIWGSQQGC